MPTSRGRYQSHYRRFVSDLAFVDACMSESLADCNGERHPRLVGSGQPADDALAPARGIVNGLRFSLMLWALIALICLLMR